MKNIVILTSTIKPPKEVEALVRIDEKERLEDYKRGLDYYLDYLESNNRIIDCIIYVDNSGVDLEPLKEIVNKRGFKHYVEFISFYGLDYPSYRGRGYGEFKLMDYTINNSEIINNNLLYSKEIKFWKISGRYIIKNLDRMIKSAPKDFNVYLNLKYWGFMRNYIFLMVFHRITWIDLFFYGFTLKGYYKYFYSLYKEIGEGEWKKVAAEYQLFNNFKSTHKSDSTFYNRFRNYPIVDVLMGYDNKKFPNRRLKLLLRSILNPFKIWI